MDNTRYRTTSALSSESSRDARILHALKDGERTRAELLAVVGGSIQGLQAWLQRLVAEGRVRRVRPGTYALAGQT